MTKFVAGGYTSTWYPQRTDGASGGLALGQTAQGYRLSHNFFKRIITGDKRAQAPQDAVYQGAEMHIQFNLIEYLEAGIASIMWPYGNYLSMGVVGRLDVQQGLTGCLILTAVTGTPAAATNFAPKALTLPRCMLSEGFPVELLMAPDLKEVPIRLRIYPADSADTFGSQT
jgi:hypothetical protein